jgi:quercetin dioxygenase-like cupin family protein
MRKLLVSALVLGVLSAVGSGALGQDKGSPAGKTPAHQATHVILNPADLKWGDAPPVFPPGAKMAVLEGNPSKAGPYTVRLKAGDGYKVAAHWHPRTENLTVISGTFYLGTGDKLDEAKGTAMSAGAFASMPAKMHHFAWFKGDTDVQVHGMGPFQLIYVNPKDDPTKAK